MSKTFKTRPLYVRIFDRKDNGVKRKAVHQHEGGRECDLPNPDVKSNLAHNEDPALYRKCYWNWSYNGRGVCGCPQCTRKYEHKEENRHFRRGAKKEIEQALIEEV